MSQKQLNPHSNQVFICDRCQRKFQNETAYSPTLNSGYLAETYCINCIDWNLNLKKEKIVENNLNNQNKDLKIWNKIKKKSLGEVPQEASQNFQVPELAPSDKRITGRTKQLNLKVREETYWLLKELALKNKCLMTEILEKALKRLRKA